MKKSIVLVCIVMAALGACNMGKKSVNPANWAGVYKGTLPCADCEGIQEEIRLNDDLSYELVATYLGKGKYNSNGSFEWDEAGSRIKLTGSESTQGDDVRWFKVGENQLTALDTEGNPIESVAGANFVLLKIDTDNVVAEKYWKLIELNGKAIAPADNDEREAHFVLHGADGTISGSTGCNRLFGEYTLVGDSLKISVPMITRMACFDIDYEQEYLDALTQCDNYAVQEGVLTLLEGETPLAQFAAVYLR